MKITNKLNLPPSLVTAIEFDDRNTEGCDYTITELLKPPRIRALEHTHAAKLTEDASDRIWSLMGRAGHEVLRRAAGGKGIVEERAIVDVEVNGRKFKIGGQLDYGAVDQELIDFKFTSVWAVKDGAKPEWVEQTNLYRWLAWHYGVNFEHIRIVCILRDWSVREAARDLDYPQSQVKTFYVKTWSWEECEKFIKWRIEEHEKAKISLPNCSSDDMWEKSEAWAAKKKGNKRATKVFYDEAEAIAFANQKGLAVEYRPAERPRCESYCLVSKFCQQFIAWQAQFAPASGQEAGWQ
jgi:hypothetical protein